MEGAKNYSEEGMMVENHHIVIQSYEIKGVFHCHVRNIDPGATIARASADSAEVARTEAIQKATSRLK